MAHTKTRKCGKLPVDDPLPFPLASGNRQEPNQQSEHDQRAEQGKERVEWVKVKIEVSVETLPNQHMVLLCTPTGVRTEQLLWVYFPTKTPVRLLFFLRL